MPFMRNGVYVNSERVTLAASTARTASGSGNAWDVGAFSTLRLTLALTAISGALTALDVVIESSADGVTWYQVGVFAQRMTTGSEQKSFSGLDRYVRARWTVTGTLPSATFSVAGEAV